MEVLALPLVAVVLFFVFGGVVAACLPVMVGGLSIAAALGIMRLISLFAPVHFFAQPVVTLIGLGIAIDYALFVVSRFREELAEGYDTETAVRRTVMTAGRTVTFSAVLIVASLAGLLLFPQGFLKSLTYAGIASVMLSAILSITVLPALLSILGPNVDALGVRTLYRIPFLRNTEFTRRIIDWFADRTQKTQTREEVEKGFWGKLVNVVMKRPVLFAAPIIIIMILLIIPLGKLSLGGFSEKYLPPTNSVRMAQEDFDKTFPGFRTEQMTLVIQDATPAQIEEIEQKASPFPVSPDSGAHASRTDEGTEDPRRNGHSERPRGPQRRRREDRRAARHPAPQGGDHLGWRNPGAGAGQCPQLARQGALDAAGPDQHHDAADVPGVRIAGVADQGGGDERAHARVDDGHPDLDIRRRARIGSAELHRDTADRAGDRPDHRGDLGLSTDYEVFLVSRMVEARARGMSTAEAIRIGTATTGRIITAAALILIVVAGAFVFSDLVMMKYLAFGLVAALLLDATVIRMFLVPAVMKMLGDDCWWAPQWMKRIQERLGLGEIDLPDERKRPARPDRSDDAALVGAGAPRGPRPPHDPTHPAVGTARAKPVRVPAGPPRAQAPPPGSPLPPRMSRRRPGFRSSAPHNRHRRSLRAKTARSSRGSAHCGAARTLRPPPRRRPPVPRERPGDEPTTAIAAQRPQDPESTEKLNTGEKEKKERAAPRRRAQRTGPAAPRRSALARTLHARLRRFREHASWALASDTLEFGDRRRRR